MDSDFLVAYVHGRHTLGEYFNLFVHERTCDAAFAECSEEFRDRCIAHLWSGFVKLDAMPRTDPFWAGSNMRATFSKLRDQVTRDPVDERDGERCWTAFVVALWAGDTDLFRRTSEVLLQTGQLSVPDFVRTSLNLLDVSGWETDELAADTLRGCASASDAQCALDDITKNGLPHRRQWAKSVLWRLARPADPALHPTPQSPRG